MDLNLPAFHFHLPLPQQLRPLISCCCHFLNPLVFDFWRFHPLLILTPLNYLLFRHLYYPLPLRRLLDLRSLPPRTFDRRSPTQRLGWPHEQPLCVRTELLIALNLLSISSFKHTRVSLITDPTTARFWQLKPSLRYPTWSSLCVSRGKGSCGTFN